MSLQTELDAFRSAWAERVGPGIVDTIRQDNEALAKSGIVENALKAGDVFPGQSLPDQRGRQRDLKAMFTEAPLVVTFYRGGWCPYCSLELRAYQQALSEIERYMDEERRKERPDLSNAQFALQAMHDAGLKPEDPAFKAALVFLSRTQNSSETNDQPWAGNDGGFVYTAANEGDS